MAVTPEQIERVTQRLQESRRARGLPALIDDEPTLRLVEAVIEHKRRTQRPDTEAAGS
jgi:hypothetical protein